MLVHCFWLFEFKFMFEFICLSSFEKLFKPFFSQRLGPFPFQPSAAVAQQLAQQAAAQFSFFQPKPPRRPLLAQPAQTSAASPPLALPRRSG
jgi:hypothetical protein